MTLEKVIDKLGRTIRGKEDLKSSLNNQMNDFRLKGSSRAVIGASISVLEINLAELKKIRDDLMQLKTNV